MFKSIKTLTTICPICEAEKTVQYGTNKETLTVRGEKIDVVAKVFYCPDENHFFSILDDDEAKIQNVYREYRKRRKLLQPEEIKEIREKYKLSQDSFSLFLGFGKKTIARYETGAIQDDGHNNFIKLMQDTESFQKQFNNVKDNLSSKLKQKIEKRLLERKVAEKQLSLPHTYATQYEMLASCNYFLTAGQATALREEDQYTVWRAPSFQTSLNMYKWISSVQVNIESADEVKIKDKDQRGLALAA